MALAKIGMATYIVMMEQELRLSLSKVKCYDSCHKKFHYSYVIKAPRKDYEFYTFGKVLHTALEQFHLVYLNGSTRPRHQEMTDAFKFAKTTYQDKITPDMLNECLQILKQYLQIISTNKQHNLSSPIKAVEQNFEMILTDKITLVGAIDRTQIDKDGILHIADYKTTKNKKYLKDDPFQLMTYAMVLMMQDPSIEKIRTSYILLRHNFEYLTWEFNREEIMLVKDKYLNYAKQIIEETEYVANPSKLCAYCDFIDQCPEGQKATKVFSGKVSW